MFQSFALHQIADAGDLAFNPADYSRFKFGDMQVTRAFGEAICEQFVRSHGDLLLSHDEIVLVPSPYNYIPTASFHLSSVIKDGLNRFLYQHGRKSLMDSKIHRYKTYSVDYGNLNFEERINLISTDTYHLDQHFLSKRLCLFVDDIKITGSHEIVIKNLIEKAGLKGDFVFLYFAELVNKSIAPNFENYLNYYFVKGLNEIDTIVHDGHFEFNTRVIKYILGSERGRFTDFADRHAPSFLRKIILYSIGNNYHLMPEYKDNLNQLIKQTNYGN